MVQDRGGPIHPGCLALLALLRVIESRLIGSFTHGHARKPDIQAR